MIHRQASAELPLYWQILTLLFVLHPAPDVRSHRQRSIVMLYSKDLRERTPYLLSAVRCMLGLLPIAGRE